ncbi:transcriptional regulator [Paraglaciecola sp. MB-3u-78]|uniref:transcriptional regulator n=1 Tax=Paraglaciecola sp. MB-3u-78 TaxID=2058332 RepID=UPI000C349658|nr:transcriptional regulator [Paraglaciecola sp. MB-3u-78]PKG97509.1 transcriptional regulator [Paraglaciecola sp. MB-3u-78]
MPPTPLSSFMDTSLDNDYHTKILADYPTSNRLLLSLFSQPNLNQMSIKQLIAWGALFEHEPATIRVAAGRLVKQGFLVAQQRGHYTLGTTEKSINQLAATWRHSLGKVAQWNGGWLSVYTAHLGRTCKQSIRIRERAFRLTGFKALEKNLWCRPDNLMETADATFARMVDIGLEENAILMKVEHFNHDLATSPVSLWSPQQLEKTYGLLVTLMEKSAQRLTDFDVNQATRESFLIGEHVIRLINQDPLLPEEMVDVSARQTLLNTMIEYDRICHPIWHEFVNHG